jgi:hypothetical protein
MPLLLIALIACSSPSSKTEGDGTPEDADTGTSVPEAIELGTGEWEWEALEDGAELPVIQGPQGGFHFLASVRVSGIEAGSADDLSDSRNPTTTFWVIHEGEHLAPTSRFVQGLDRASEDARPYRHEMIGRFVIMDIASDSELDGVEVELGVRIEDVDGRSLETAINVVSYPHPLNHG